jgi:hypothetical protein
METIIFLTADQVKARLIELLAIQATPKFIAVKNYRNNEGEVSNYVINIGVDYGKAKQADTEKLKDAANFAGLEGYSDAARIALLEASLKPSKQSKAQSDAYTQLCDNIRMHNETGRLYVNGFKISKTVVDAIEYPEVNSSALTIAKNIIRKELKATKFRQFCFDKLVEIRMNGETLEFDF